MKRKIKKLFKKVKNVFLWSLFYLNLASFLFSICCLDSEYYLFFGGVAFLNFIFMALFYIANYDIITKKLNRMA